MESSQAVDCVKEFGNIRKAVSFERTDALTGYIIRVDGLTYESDREAVRSIAKKLCLAVQEDTDSIAIL